MHDTRTATPTEAAAPAAPADPLAAPGAAPRAEARSFDIDCALKYQVNGPTDFVFQIHALHGMGQEVLSESLVITPELPTRVYAEPNLAHRFVRMHADAGEYEVRYRARVRRSVTPVDPDAPEVPIAELPDEALHYLLPSRYCESDHLSRAAQRLFGGLPQGYRRVEAIVDWMQREVEYKIGTSQPTTTARDVFVQRAGVCRDFAQLPIAFCRALNIPARLVVGYARFDDPPPDFHAVFEAFVGGRWVLFDATHMSPLDDLIRIATGRDAIDVAFATIFGPTTMLSMAPCVAPVS